MKCIGEATGPKITLTKKVIPGLKNPGRMDAVNFGDVELGSSVTRVVILRNDDNIPATYQFIAERNGSFAFDHPQGSIPTGFETNVVITFRPKEPGNYYRRIFCLLHNQTPAYIDFIGTAYDDKRRPMPLKDKHVDAFRRRRLLGYGKLSPDEVEDLIANNSTTAQLLAGSEEEEEKFNLQLSLPSRSGGVIEKELACLHEFFEDSNDSSHEIIVEETSIDFGFTSRNKISEKKTIHITNKTHGKVVAMWRVTGADDLDENHLNFSVFPLQQDINPGKTVTFSVSFKPLQENYYYCEDIECFVFAKKNRNFRLINEVSFTPPWYIY